MGAVQSASRSICLLENLMICFCIVHICQLLTFSNRTFPTGTVCIGQDFIHPLLETPVEILRAQHVIPNLALHSSHSTQLGIHPVYIQFLPQQTSWAVTSTKPGANTFLRNKTELLGCILSLHSHRWESCWLCTIKLYLASVYSSLPMAHVQIVSNLLPCEGQICPQKVLKYSPQLKYSPWAASSQDSSSCQGL